MTTATQTTSTITGRDLAAGSSRARLKQRELAGLVKHSEPAIQIWEERGVPAGKVAMVRSVLGPHLFEADENPLSQYSDLALLAELAKRLDASSNRDIDVTDSDRGAGI